MVRNFKPQLGLKFFAILALIIVSAAVPFTFFALDAINKYGLEAAEINELEIRSQAFSYLKEITRERAARYQGVFDRITASVSLLSRQASTIYSNITYYSASPLENYQFHAQPENGFWMNSIEDPVVSAYWGAPDLDSDIRHELLALTHITPLFKQSLIDNPEVLASHVITVSGIGQYCTDSQESKESVFKLPPVSEFDLRNGEPMTVFTKSSDATPGVRWTNIYKDDVIDGLMLTASGSIYDNKGVFRGITGIDVPLDNVISDILHSRESDSRERPILFSFLLNQNSKVIAIPQPYSPLFGLSVDHSKLINSADRLDIALSDSSKKDVRELADYLHGREAYLGKISHDTKSYLVATHRMAKLGWIVGVVAREEDMLRSIVENRQALSQTIGNIEFKGILLSLLTLCIAIAAVFLAIRQLILPLRSLIAATDLVAGGDLATRCQVTTSDEVGLLATSFNSMVARLQDFQKKQDDYSKSLESEVERRNIELSSRKDELETTVDLLNREVERRQIISNALKSSQQQYLDTLDASLAGVFIIENYVYTYVNSSFADMVRTTRERLTGVTVLDIVHEEDRQLVSANARRRLQGENVPPYTVKWLRFDGTTFYGEVWGKVTSWQGREVMVGTISDVTDIKKKEMKIELQDRQLQKSLDEKEVLLKEIYHRTKNNMLVIISLLDLQTQDIEDERVKTIFFETESRIRAMALVHEKLYQSKNLSAIDLGEYLHEVAESLLVTMVVGNRIKLVSDTEPISIPIDYAVPLGLVINEIVTNAIKHAFPGVRSGTLSINLKKDLKGEIVLIIGDDGIGLPEEIDVNQASSFGMKIIIRSLVELQLKGTLSVGRQHGTSYRISFAEPRARKRI